VSDFSYRLCVLTHGDAPTLDRTIESFAEMVTPPPTDLVCVVDGPGRMPPVEPLGPWRGVALARQSGFCSATKALWELACEDGPDHCVWLENDLVVTEPVDLHPLAAILDADPTLAQMSLMRDAVNDLEKMAGGVYELRQDEYEDMAVWVDDVYLPWKRHSIYYTTNISLLRRQFMRENPWPTFSPPDQCEGKFGIELVKRGYRFGVWGDGHPMTKHIGIRTGHGY
jgi:hypothetical protein